MKKSLLLARTWLLIATLSVLAATALAQPTAPAEAPITFAIIGDNGTGDDNQYAIARQMEAAHEKLRYEFVVMLGDNIYASPSPQSYRERFEMPYKKLLDNGVKFQAVLGNHDVEKDKGAYQLKYAPMGFDGQRYYSYTKGDGLIEFFALDSNNMDKDQLKWLEGKLAASTARWKIAYYHHPIYSSGERHGASSSLRKKLEPLFEKYKVDAAFSGHDHVYERLNPQKGVQYFVAGSGGAIRKGNLKDNSKYTAAGYDEACVFLIASVTRTQFRIEAISSKGATVDTFTMTKAAAAAATH